ncbi:MAG: tRNA-dihydrouridine synthase family protein [Synergistaceae bacterium]|nr:tRNA-dihydrouridine synthase family protein [Synergistaceae bacterium]
MNAINPAKIKTGGLELDNEIWLAPLAGVTTAPVREFFSRLGAGLTHTEMISCMGLLRDNRKTENMLLLLPEEGKYAASSNVVLQLFSGDADSMVKGAEAALAVNARMGPLRFAALGINMACPMPKVTKRGAGAALMGAPDTASEMTRGLKSLGLPVWVKTRVSSDITETLRFVELLFEAGADNVCIHGRTPPQRYEGRADRAKTAETARRFPGGISASGDVYLTEDVREYLDMGCVGVMLARGALANPYLLPQALSALGREVSEADINPAKESRLLQLRLLAERIRDISGASHAVVLIKRILAGTLKGAPGIVELRRRVGVTTDLDELMRLLEVEG